MLVRRHVSTHGWSDLENPSMTLAFFQFGLKSSHVAMTITRKSKLGLGSLLVAMAVVADLNGEEVVQPL